MMLFPFRQNFDSLQLSAALYGRTGRPFLEACYVDQDVPAPLNVQI